MKAVAQNPIVIIPGVLFWDSLVHLTYVVLEMVVPTCREGTQGAHEWSFDVAQRHVVVQAALRVEHDVACVTSKCDRVRVTPSDVVSQADDAGAVLATSGACQPELACRIV